MSPRGIFEMLTINATSFSSLLLGLKSFEETLNGEHLKEVVPPESIREILRGRIEDVDQTLVAMELPICSCKAGRIKEIIGDGKKTSQIASAFTVLVETIPEELAGRGFLYLQPKEMALYGNLLPFGKEVNAAFPSSAFHVIESSKCLALGRGTASVYHLMCALEPCLKATAKALQVTTSNPSWGPVIDDLQKKVETLPGAQDPDSDRTFYSDALAHISSVKNAWRNHCNHARSKYTEEEAEQIYGAIKAAMKNLCKRIKE